MVGRPWSGRPAGSIRDSRCTTARTRRWRARSGSTTPASRPACVKQPGRGGELMENHDNQTLFDINAIKLPTDHPQGRPRARCRCWAAAINAFSRGIACYTPASATLRSRSLDRNSYDSRLVQPRSTGAMPQQLRRRRAVRRTTVPLIAAAGECRQTAGRREIGWTRSDPLAIRQLDGSAAHRRGREGAAGS